MEKLHLTDEEVAEDHDLLFKKQKALDGRVQARPVREKALRAILAMTPEPHNELTPSAAMASSMKRNIIETRLSEIDHPVQEAADHQQVARNFSIIYGHQLHEQARTEMQSGL